jgi:para-aminobenzoate synthetase component 1
VPLPPACAFVVSRELPPAPGLLARFEDLRRRPHAWLLDSSLPSPRLGRWSFAGADPYAVLRVWGERCELECRRAVRRGFPVGRRSLRADPLELLRALAPPPPEGADTLLAPFVGGAVGYFGYELAARFETLALPAEDDLGLPDAVLLLVDRLLAHDHASGASFALGLGFGDDAASARRAAEHAASEVSQAMPTASHSRWHPASEVRSEANPSGGAGYARAVTATLGQAGYTKAILYAREEIAAGNLYQACLTRREERRFGGDPWALYLALRRRNPAPFACFFELPEAAIVGSSPERFLAVDAGGRVESRPIKGTRPRGRDPVEDARERRALLASAKDRAENLMIVDLVRNDLGRVCEIGSVEVPELMAVEEYASVFHLVSTVRGRLRPDCDALDALRAAFPPGSMTGAPKLAAMRLLGRLEPVRRGAYSGAIGYLDARGGADLAVVIRSIVLVGDRACLHTGGGIVADSQPEAEWLETIVKARPLLAALEAADRQAAPELSCRAFDPAEQR